MGNEKINCPILVLSCDQNISVVNIFFKFFEENWYSCPHKIYLGMEKHKVNFNNVTTLYSCGKWGYRLLKYLEAINTDYIFLVLEDFILENKVNTECIQKYIEIMKENIDIVNIALAEIYDKRNIGTSEPHLMRRPKNADYLMNLQAGIWRVDFLKKIIREKENPWQTELYGSVRAREYKNKIFLCLDSDKNSPYKYGRGWLVVRGKWNGNEIKRLKLEEFGEYIFDGKDIIYDNLMKIHLISRIKRRGGIEARKFFGHLGVYF